MVSFFVIYCDHQSLNCQVLYFRCTWNERNVPNRASFYDLLSESLFVTPQQRGSSCCPCGTSLGTLSARMHNDRSPHIMDEAPHRNSPTSRGFDQRWFPISFEDLVNEIDVTSCILNKSNFVSLFTKSGVLTQFIWWLIRQHNECGEKYEKHGGKEKKTKENQSSRIELQIVKRWHERGVSDVKMSRTN